MNNNEKVTVDNIEVTHNYCGTSQCCMNCDTAFPVQLELFEKNEYESKKND